MEYIPDPVEIMESNIERMIGEYVEGHCMACDKKVDYELLPVSGAPDAPVVCFECLNPESPESLSLKKSRHIKVYRQGEINDEAVFNFFEYDKREDTVEISEEVFLEIKEAMFNYRKAQSKLASLIK